MCIVIDPGCIPAVFDVSAQDHSEFKPISDWICTGKGKMIYGGKKYRNEMSKLGKYLSVIAELRRGGRAIEIDNKQVDKVQQSLELRKKHRNFDDAHLIAIVIISGVMLVCTKDKRACPFIKDKRLYPKGSLLPRIYSKSRNKNLISNKYIAGICSGSGV